MYHLTGLPGWMRYGHHGPRSQYGHSRWHHGAMLWESSREPYRTGHWWARPTVQEEQDFLREQAEALRRYLERIERRISQLEPSDAQEEART